jgi:putative membrane protein
MVARSSRRHRERERHDVAMAERSDRGIIGNLLVHWLIVGVAIAIATAIIPGIEVDGGFGTVLWIAVIFGLVNALVGTILRLLSLPLMVLTLGLFSLVITAFMWLLTDALSDNLDIDGFMPALGGAILVSVLTAILGWFVDRRHGD